MNEAYLQTKNKFYNKVFVQWFQQLKLPCISQAWSFTMDDKILKKSKKKTQTQKQR